MRIVQKLVIFSFGKTLTIDKPKIYYQNEKEILKMKMKIFNFLSLLFGNKDFINITRKLNFCRWWIILIIYLFFLRAQWSRKLSEHFVDIHLKRYCFCKFAFYSCAFNFSSCIASNNNVKFKRTILGCVSSTFFEKIEKTKFLLITIKS